ncbi:hypothetical protein QUG69_24205, partial [Enterobacter hormaechei]|uniref:hypothetical protein n=1 Tax=Enterobacter hormaechei TaxID=158836 RepID=UPI0025A2F2B9
DIKGNKLDAAANFFGISTPLRGSSFDVNYDLHWRAAPWQPDVARGFQQLARSPAALCGVLAVGTEIWPYRR